MDNRDDKGRRSPTTAEIKEMLKIIPNGFCVTMEDLIKLWNLN